MKISEDQTKKAKQRAKETLEILEHGFTTERKIHNGYQEYENAKKKYLHKRLEKMPFKLMFGKYQYIFTKGDLQISLVKLNDSPLSNKKDKWYWEMFAFEDKRLFTDVKKFLTKKNAMEEIKRILSD